MSGKKLTIGCATFDDYSGVYFTIQSIRMTHPELLDLIEFVVVDNNPGGVCSDALKQLLEYWVGGKYIPFNKFTSTAVRNQVFENATGEAVLCLDSHVLLSRDALPRLLDYYERHPDCKDLMQGPLVYDDGRSISTHFAPEWRAEMWGTWATDERGKDPAGEPFEIPMCGLGLFTCRRDAWLGFHPGFRQFGGEEGYIHEKFRMAGHRALCLPFLRWMHRFHRVGGPPYPLTLEGKLRNYLIGFLDLGMDITPVLDHFARVSQETKQRLIAEAEQLLVNHGRFCDRVARVERRPMLELPACA